MTDAATLNHFRQIVEKIQPDMLQLEHPFMWPLANRLSRDSPTLPIVYSSHNVEAPLKRTILENFGVSPDLSGRIYALIEQIEAELCDSAALILCVSASDREHYLRHKPSATIVVPNGVDHPPKTISDDKSVRAIFGDNRFLFMVGSAYPPNVDGFCECVVRDGIFICPPRKTIAVCGGVSDGIFAHSEFQRFAGANESRIQFFPKLDDPELWSIKTACHAVMLPLLSGGGSNLKTAEALALGKWVVATPTALRGFETFMDAEGVILAKDRHAFRRALARTLGMPPLEISEPSRKARDNLYWDALFANSELAGRLARL